MAEVVQQLVLASVLLVARLILVDAATAGLVAAFVAAAVEVAATVSVVERVVLAFEVSRLHVAAVEHC